MSGKSSGRSNGASRSAVSVVGGGAWGVALATAASNAGSDVMLYARRDGVSVRGVRVTRSLADAAAHASLVVLAVPSHVTREVARSLGDSLDGHHALVHGVRGLVAEGDTLRTISAVLRDETPARRIGALGGPVLTTELLAGTPSVIVVGSRYPDVLEAVRGAFISSALRVYTTEDLVGLEWASALTGILAVAVGFARAQKMGAGIVAAFVTRAVQEAARIAVAAGAEERTMLGLGGFGDLLAAIADDARPEVKLGEAIARGEKVDVAVKQLDQRIEAIALAPQIVAMARRARVPAPIFEAIAHGILADVPVADLVAKLMATPIVSAP
ncbi:MAG: NAD(P)-binding domain-containing protein [Polyangiales bacterium]